MESHQDGGESINENQSVCTQGRDRVKDFPTFRDGYEELTSMNEELNEVIKDVKRRWTQDLLPNSYSLTDLMATASKTSKNVVADGGWTLAERNSLASKNGKDSTEAKFLVLSAQIEALTRGSGGGKMMGTGTNLGPTEVSWRFQNQGKKSTLTRNEQKYKRCSKGCHKKPMWCGCPNCLPKEEFKVKKEARLIRPNYQPISKSLSQQSSPTKITSRWRHSFYQKNRRRGRLKYTIAY